MKSLCHLLLLLLSTIHQAHSFGLPCASVAQGYASTRNRLLQQRHLHLSVKGEDLGEATIDRQSDEKYGRGDSHISADLSEGDVIAFQDGTWYVDGNEVGDGSDPVVRYLLVDTIQLVWTHDCEHGVVNGFDIMIAENDLPASIDGSGAIVNKGSYFVIQENEYIQCGPEQILAKLPSRHCELKWKDSGNEVLMSLVDFVPDDEVMIE